MNSEEPIPGETEALQMSETGDPQTTKEASTNADHVEVAEAPPAVLPAAEEPTETLSPSASEADQATGEPTDGSAEEPMTDEEIFLAAVQGDMPLDSEYDVLLTPLSRGQIIKGTITSKSESEILVDVGTKSEGIIAGRELEALDAETFNSLQVGQEIYVYVIVPENREGHPQLSLRRAMEEQDWITAEDYRSSGKIYESKIVGFNKGGLLVPFGKLRGFVPASQISQERRRRSGGSTPDQRWGGMVGEEVAVKVIEVDRGRNRLILSELAANEELRLARRAQLLESIEVGQVLKGRVISLAEFGAFVDLGGVDGLIHISELSWKPISHPREEVKVGDELEVEVISVDRERQRIGLSRKRRLPDPWLVATADLHADQLVQGVITKMTKFGAFARLVEHPEIEGLIHISELAEHRVRHPREVVQEGEVLTLRILRIDPENRRLGLSLRQVDSEKYLDEDWQAVFEATQQKAPVPAEAEIPSTSDGESPPVEEDA